MDNTYLSFTICNEFFAVNVLKVLEVLQKQNISKVPNSPDFIKGIINFRGEMVPAFDTRSKFKLTEREADESYVIIVLDLSSDTELFRVGAIVDKVEDVIVIPDVEIMPVPAMSKDFNTAFLQGIFKLKDEFIMLLDVDKFFAGQELEVIKDSVLTE